MSAPAHDHVRFDVGLEQTRVAQDLENGVRDAVRIVERESARFDLRGDVGDIAHHSEQQFVDAADDLAVDERIRRRVLEFELDAAILLQHLDIEIGIAMEDVERVVAFASRREHRERAALEQCVQAAMAGVAQTLDFIPRQNVHTRHRRDAGAH